VYVVLVKNHQLAGIRQLAGKPRGVRTSLPLALWLRRGQPHHHASCSLPPADGAAGRSTDSVRHPTPRLRASPSLGVDCMPRQASNTLVHPSPLLLASPFTGVDGRLCSEGGSQQQTIPLPADPTLSPLRPPCGPVSYETGHVPAIPQLIHRERNSFACMKVVSPVGFEPASKYETAPASKKSRCHAAFRPYRTPLARHAPIAEGGDARWSS
jgi:hypothetical protein